MPYLGRSCGRESFFSVGKGLSQEVSRGHSTVNQDRLINIIRRTIKDGEVVSLIRKFLESGVMENGKYQPTKVGTPQGGNISLSHI